MFVGLYAYCYSLRRPFRGYLFNIIGRFYWCGESIIVDFAGFDCAIAISFLAPISSGLMTIGLIFGFECFEFRCFQCSPTSIIS